MDAEVIRGGGEMFVINIGRFVIVRPITATASEGQRLPELFEIRSNVLPQSSFMSSITLKQPINDYFPKQH